ncbi:MAG: helix-turn-helix domain-containing protein, partial [Acidimicrobiales bacterium]
GNADPMLIESTPTQTTSRLGLERRRLGLSVRGAAGRANIDPAHWSRIERGLALPSVVVLARIAAVVGVLPGELLYTLSLPPKRDG